MANIITTPGLPGARSQAGGRAPNVQREVSKPTLAQEMLQVAGGLAPIVGRLNARAQQQEIQSQESADAVALGNLDRQLNEVELQQLEIADARSKYQQAAIDLQTFKADGVLNEQDADSLLKFNSSMANLDALRQQNPHATSAQQVAIKERRLLAEFQSANPRLSSEGTKIFKTVTGRGSTVSGPQSQHIIERNKKIEELYGPNPGPQATLQWTKFEVQEKQNGIQLEKNKIAAQNGELKLVDIAADSTADFDLNISKITEKWIHERERSGGVLTHDRTRQGYTAAIGKVLAKAERLMLEGQNAANAGGSAHISRVQVAEQLEPLRKLAADRIAMFEDETLGDIVKKASDTQKAMFDYNIGNSVKIANNIAGGNNQGGLDSLLQILNNKDGQSKDALGDAYKKGGFDQLYDTLEGFAAKTAEMLNNPNPPKTGFEEALVFHGIAATRNGPVSETVKSNLLDGISTLSRSSSIPNAVAVLNEDPLSRQIGTSDQVNKNKFKQTVTAMDTDIAIQIEEQDKNVFYNTDTEQFVVYSVSQRSNIGHARRVQGPRELTNVVVDGGLTRDLNATYSLRSSGKYQSILEPANKYVKSWLDQFETELDVSEDLLTEEEEVRTAPRMNRQRRGTP